MRFNGQLVVESGLAGWPAVQAAGAKSDHRELPAERLWEDIGLARSLGVSDARITAILSLET